VIKPDIAAPGMGIGSSLSANHGTTTAWILEDGVHFITQGTSMACPHVTGVVALILEAFGPLSRNEVLAKLTDTARVDAFTGTVPNPAFGGGKIDALTVLLQPTPVLLLGMEVNRDATGVHLTWSVPESIGSARFLVERTDVGSESAAHDGPRVLLGVTGSGPEYQFVDPGAPVGTGSYYWLTAIQDPEVVLGPFAAPAEGVPPGLSLSPPGPNPFSNRVSWNLTLPEAGRVTVDLIDAAGRRVTRLGENLLPAGTASYSWDGRNASGDPVGSGVYFVRAEWNGRVETERVLLVR
jgi:subtilisin family serine protease